MKSVVSRLLRKYAIVILLIAVSVCLSIFQPSFLSVRNFRNILDQNAGLGIVSCGMTFVIIAGGFDLSVAAAFALCGLVAAIVTIAAGVWCGVLAGCLVGVAVGIANGFRDGGVHPESLPRRGPTAGGSRLS